MTTRYGPLFTRPSQRVLMFWAALALLNLAAAVFISSQDNRMTDVESVMRWGRDWLVNRVDVYHPADSGTDYPPHAVVLLSPLGLLPHAIAIPLWALFNLCLAVAAPYLAARFYRPDAPFKVILLPILMFLCWGGMRTLLQFSLLALTLSMASLALSNRRPIASGALLGLALIKPQVALPVFCWAMFTRRWKLVFTAIGVVAAGFAIFCLWSNADPFFVVRRYTGILARYHTGEALLAGISELRPAIRALATDVSDVDAIAGSIALGMFAGICVAGLQEGSARRRLLYAAPPLVACWSLLTFYHLTYGFIVLLPVMMMLALNDTERSPLRTWLFWVLQIGMMFDVPGLARRAGVTGGVLGAALSHTDRLLMLGLFASLVVLAWEEPPSSDQPGGADQVVG